MVDQDIEKYVQNALDWEPSVDASDINLSVDHGIVTLRGNVRTYAERVAAERVALRVYGVKAVANTLGVRLESGHERPDADLAAAAVTALKWNTRVPNEHVAVTATNGWLTLTGTVEWQYQKDAAARALRDLTGVKGVTNDIRVEPFVKTGDVRDKIEAALQRSAEIDARRITVDAQDGKVVLSGHVHSWAERQEAERAAWAAPGVRQVEDHLTVVP